MLAIISRCVLRHQNVNESQADVWQESVQRCRGDTLPARTTVFQRRIRRRRNAVLTCSPAATPSTKPCVRATPARRGRAAPRVRASIDRRARLAQIVLAQMVRTCSAQDGSRCLPRVK